MTSRGSGVGAWGLRGLGNRDSKIYNSSHVSYLARLDNGEQLGSQPCKYQLILENKITRFQAIQNSSAATLGLGGPGLACGPYV